MLYEELARRADKGDDLGAVRVAAIERASWLVGYLSRLSVLSLQRAVGEEFHARQAEAERLRAELAERLGAGVDEDRRAAVLTVTLAEKLQGVLVDQVVLLDPFTLHGLKVHFYYRARGSKTWHDYGNAVLGRNGNFRFGVAKKRGYYVKVVLPAQGVYHAAPSGSGGCEAWVSARTSPYGWIRSSLRVGMMTAPEAVW